MKILFICGWPLGTRGTPGTYKIIQSAMKIYEVRVLSPEPNNPVIDLSKFSFHVCSGDKEYMLNIDEISSHITSFNPAVIHIFNHPHWPKTAAALKLRFPHIKITLDIKTPLLREGEARLQIQELGNNYQETIDLVFTHAYESIFTWIPNFSGKWCHYPPGIDVSFYPEPKRSIQKRPARFVYIGAINLVRKLADLIAAFSSFYHDYNYGQTLDIYGSGAREDGNRLLAAISQHKVEGIVRFHGLIPQDELAKVLVTYEVGLAWVPTEKFDTSPSLKLIEYVIAGLGVVATNTAAHRNMRELGFKLQLGQDNVSGFVGALIEFHNNWREYFGEPQKRNYELALQFDYENIFTNKLLPQYQQLSRKRERESLATFKQLKNSLTLILVIETLSAGRGGAEKTAVLLAEEMARRGHRVYLAYLGKAGPSYKVSKSVKLLPYRDSSDLKRQVLNISPSVYFVFYFNESLLTHYSIIHETGIPFGMQECTNPDRLISRNWRRGECGVGIAAYEREIIASRAARIRMVMPSYLNSFPPYVRHQARGIPNGCVAEKPVKLDLQELKGRKFILNVNGFKPNKGLDVIASAFRQLANTYPEWDLVIVGKEPKKRSTYAQDILDTLDDLIKNNRVLILQSRNDIAEIFSLASIHVIGSPSEGCPNVVLEAMAAGVPSIGLADCPGTNELIRHKIDGLLIKGDDLVSAMVDAFKELMDSQSILNEYSAQSLVNSKQYDSKNIYDQWELLFLEASTYKNSDLLFREQAEIDPERASHAERMIHLLVSKY